MTMYRTLFYRLHCGFDPPLRQESEVLVVTDIPYEDGHLGEFEAALWEAMWVQNPHWKNPAGPNGTDKGWSSVLHNAKHLTVAKEAE